jgi:hypothetical protein
MLKSQTKVHKSCSKSIFDILADNLINLNVLNSYKKRKKIQKNDFWGLCPGLNCMKMDPK